METKNLYPTLIASLLAFGVLAGGMLKCSEDGKAAMLRCIELTSKPLECKAPLLEGP